MVADASDSSTVLAVTEKGRPTSTSELEDEVAALFDQFRMPVLRFILSFRIPVADAEELVQEVFLKLFHHLRQGRPRVNLQGWIFRVANNEALKNRARGKRYSDRFIHIPGLSGVAADHDPGPEQAVATLQRRERLLTLVAALPEQDQHCLALRAEGLRYREISEVLGISLGSVAASLEKSLSRLARAEQV